jgi:UDP-2,3-diacylglucosamine hydrolase
MQIPPGKRIYFLSDFHLGSPSPSATLDREKLIVRFLDEVKSEAHTIFIVGDMFDFWYEYKTVVPKGHVRLLGSWQTYRQRYPNPFFVGNLDMWMRSYLQTELNIRFTLMKRFHL